MARHISEREMRRIERERRKEEDEERKLLEELNRELNERQEMELRNLREQQKKIRRENAEKLERRRQINEKQKQIDEMKEKERIKTETQNRSDEIKYKYDNTSPTMLKKVLKGDEYTDYDDDESWTDAKSNESEFDDTYTTIEDIDLESALKIGYPQDASSFIDSHREKLRTVQNEIKWLEQEERKYHRENDDIDRINQRKNEKVVETSHRNLEDNKHLSLRDRMREHKTYQLFDTYLQIEDNEDRDNDYSHSDEENVLKEKIEQLQREKRLVADNIERNKLLKEKQRKEAERKRMEDMKLRKEIRKKKEERLRKLKDEQEILENELKMKKSTLIKLEREPEPEKEYTHKTVNKEKQEEKVMKVYPKTEKLLKPAVPKLTESTFDEWKIEVEVIMNSGLYDENMLRQAVKNSLSGQTRKILLTIPASTSTRDIIEKLDGVYGNFRSRESVLAEFYMARQRRNEGIAEWGIRLESILQTALEKGQIHESQKDEMLKTRFWRQLYSEELKNVTRMYFETSETFEELRRKVRVEENEIKTIEDEHDIDKSYSTNKLNKGANEEMEVLQDLVDRLKVIEEEVSSAKETRANERREQDYWRRSGRDEHRQDDYYRREKRYTEGERRDDIRYPREEERYRNKDIYYREESRYDDRYRANRERGRYSPSDRITDRQGRKDEDRNWRYRDDRSSYNRERGQRWRQDDYRNTIYDRDDRTSYGDRRQRDYERDKTDNREDRRQERNHRDYDKTEENVKERDERQYNRNREEGERRTEDLTTDTKNDLNSKMSLGQIRGRNEDQSPKPKLFDRIIGSINIGDIQIEDKKTKGIVDTGSMVTTMSLDLYNTLHPKPPLLPLKDFNLELKAANGQKVPYLGYTEARITIPFMKENSFDVPILIVPATDINSDIPVIIGTNVIRLCREEQTDTTDRNISVAWDLAFQSIANDTVGIVRSTHRITLQPFETKTITGFVRKTKSVEAAVTEPCPDHQCSSRVSVCPRVVRLNNPGKTARVPVRVFNLSAKRISIPTKSNLCELQEVNVLREVQY